MTKFKSYRLKKLAGLLTEEIATVEDLENWDNPDYKRKTSDVGELEQSEDMNIDDLGPMKEMLFEWPAYLRCIHLWFHGAHHVTRGVGFAGDHTQLYDRIYTEVQDEVDGAIEKIVGLCNDENLACPECLTNHALKCIKKYKSPTKLEAGEIPQEGIRIIKDYIAFIEDCRKQLEEMGKLTLGLEDALGATCNTHETYVYLLQQRAKRGL
jgi:DNA-binding ferritin-like protein